MNWFRAAAMTAATLSAVGCNSQDVKKESLSTASQAVTLPTHVVEGYWHNFYNSSVCPMRLTQVPSYYDVIHVSFAENAGSGNVAFTLYTPKAGEPCTALDVAQFKADIQTLKAQNKAVVLSLGGGEGQIAIGSAAEQTNFVNSLKSILTTWGFSGLDIDLEGGAGFTHGSQIQALLPGAITTLGDWYATQPSPLGGHMFLTMAPEHPYVQGGVVAYSGIWGAYLPMIDSLRSRLDILHVQLYNNSSVPTPQGAPYNGQNFPVDSVDNLVASVKMLIEGFDTSGGPHFNGLNASQVAFGVPSGSKSSGAPWISTSTINNAYKCVTANTNCQTIHMNATQPNLRGTMTWSINWDVYAQQAGITLPLEVDMLSVKTNMGGGGCTPKTCANVGVQCGTGLGDGCGGTLNCGCPTGQTCNTSNQCVTSCTPTTCSALGATCGSPSNGCGGTLSCGTCAGGSTCNTAFQCVAASCTPTTCAAAGATCGSPSDACGGTLACGACPNGGDNCAANFTCVGELKASFKMDAFWGTSQLIDSTANNNYATISGTVTNVTGKIGNAMQFDGGASYATIDNAASIHQQLTGQPGASVTAWLKNDGKKAGCTGTNCKQQVFYSFATSSTGGFTMRITENYELSCGGRAQSTDTFQELKTSYLWQGQWVFAACVFDAANKKIRMFVNGSEVTNMTTSWTASTMTIDSAATNTKDAIGGLPNSGDNRGFKGAIDQLKLHNKVLSQSEITTLYQEGGGTSCTPKTTCSTGAVCGTQPDGCGGLVNCGSCSGGQTCTSSNTCVSSCTAKTCSNVGAGGTAVGCGAPSDGCGGTLSCGTCTTGNVCNASFQCVAACTPSTCASLGKNCGTISDGCAATLNCGSCSAGNVCTNNVCQAGTGGACAGLQDWSASTPWTDYAGAAPYSQRKWNNHKWECTNRGYCYYEPGTTYGGYGWTDKGGC